MEASQAMETAVLGLHEATVGVDTPLEGGTLGAVLPLLDQALCGGQMFTVLDAALAVCELHAKHAERGGPRYPAGALITSLRHLLSSNSVAPRIAARARVTIEQLSHALPSSQLGVLCDGLATPYSGVRVACLAALRVCISRLGADNVLAAGNAALMDEQLDGESDVRSLAASTASEYDDDDDEEDSLIVASNTNDDDADDYDDDFELGSSKIALPNRNTACIIHDSDDDNNNNDDDYDDDDDADDVDDAAYFSDDIFDEEEHDDDDAEEEGDDYDEYDDDDDDDDEDDEQDADDSDAAIDDESNSSDNIADEADSESDPINADDEGDPTEQPRSSSTANKKPQQQQAFRFGAFDPNMRFDQLSFGDANSGGLKMPTALSFDFAPEEHSSDEDDDVKKPTNVVQPSPTETNNNSDDDDDDDDDDDNDEEDEGDVDETALRDQDNASPSSNVCFFFIFRFLIY